MCQQDFAAFDYDCFLCLLQQVVDTLKARPGVVLFLSFTSDSMGIGVLVDINIHGKAQGGAV